MRIITTGVLWAILCVAAATSAHAQDSSTIVGIESNPENTTGTISVAYVLNSRPAAYLEVWAHRRLGKSETDGIRLGVLPINFGGATASFTVNWWNGGISYHPNWARLSSKVVYIPTGVGIGSGGSIPGSPVPQPGSRAWLESFGLDTRYLGDKTLTPSVVLPSVEKKTDVPEEKPVWTGW